MRKDDPRFGCYALHPEMLSYKAVSAQTIPVSHRHSEGDNSLWDRTTDRTASCILGKASWVAIETAAIKRKVLWASGTVATKHEYLQPEIGIPKTKKNVSSQDGFVIVARFKLLDWIELELLCSHVLFTRFPSCLFLFERGDLLW